MIKARLESLEFVGGVTVPLNADSVVVIVGPNNSGKSAVLAAVRTRLASLETAPSSLVRFSVLRETSIDDILSALSSFKDAHGVFRIPGATVFEHQLKAWWTGGDEVVGPYLTSQILCDLNTRSRLADCDPAPAFESRNPGTASHPFQRMYSDDRLEKKASDIFRAAFKRDLLIHRAASNSIPAYVGERPKVNKEAEEDRLSRSYIDKVEALDRLETQGDGVRSFASIVGRVITESRPIQLIDEPEAFLPPPLAQLIARSILNDSGSRQTLIATHSSDVLRGLLSGGLDRVSVVRLTRPASGAQSNYLEADQVSDLWRDPILRFSNVLDGLFHEGVILTEADADCRFYQALAFESIPESERPSIHYTYSGGKDRLPVVIKALVSLKVPVVTIADFDLLNNDQPLRRIVEAHGGFWADVVEDWSAIKKAVEESSAFTDGARFRKEVITLLDSYGDELAVPKKTLKDIERLSRRASPWDNAKGSGLSVIPTGEATVRANKLLAKLKELGIFVAPSGEMEGFCRSIGGHGPRWVAQVIKDKDLGTDEELAPARAFIQDVNRYLLGKS
ncbi:ATP-dependent nuclease [Paracidovorax konjaci]|uniref:Uncharacterized protein n=1 Tax=Paracidovorax konjaci TaxID=32040 RepID=A0A1I1RH84_9BURK|nr:TOPRIM nucleotidyl transferase/hydrolase domain-containing protein [Paracidovorax konjaci]SFD33671.1 hypothetical protein SAMN04489710_101133 [Paracidovorax konjaci]